MLSSVPSATVLPAAALPWLSAASPGLGQPLRGLDWLSLSSDPASSLTEAERRDRDRPLARADRYFPVVPSATLPTAAPFSAAALSDPASKHSHSVTDAGPSAAALVSGSSTRPPSRLTSATEAISEARRLGSTPGAWISACLRLLGLDGPGHTSAERVAALEVCFVIQISNICTGGSNRSRVSRGSDV